MNPRANAELSMKRRYLLIWSTPCFYRPRIFNHVHESPLYPTKDLSQLNPVHTFTPNFSVLHEQCLKYQLNQGNIVCVYTWKHVLYILIESSFMFLSLMFPVYYR